MKIPGSIRELYADSVDSYKLLKEKVDKKINSLKNPKWHFESRVKTEQSFALKIETGRCENPNMLEDFFACTIVVENQKEISNAINLVNTCGYEIESQRPPNGILTFKRPESFPFDDLRLYVRFKDGSISKPTELNNLLFEIQLKTYLQHAWAIATHDLIYKAKTINWSKQRIAFQVKAMLEHAEVAISEAEDLAQSQYLNKCDKTTIKLNKITDLLTSIWPESQLPQDLKRFSDTILALIKAIRIDISRLKQILDKETSEGRGAKILNLSPYGIIIQTIFKYETRKVSEYLNNNRAKVKLLITREMDLPEYVKKSSPRNLIFI